MVSIPQSLWTCTKLKEVLLAENFGKLLLVRLDRGGRVGTALRKQLRNGWIGISRDFRDDAWSDRNQDSMLRLGANLPN